MDIVSGHGVQTRQKGASNAKRVEGERIARRGRGRDGGPVRGARGIHRRLRDVSRGRGRNAAVPRAAGRSLPEPALGIRGRRNDHVQVRGSRRGLRGRRRLLRTARSHPRDRGRHGDDRVQSYRPVRADDGGRRPAPRGGARRMSAVSEGRIDTRPVDRATAAAIEAAEARAWTDLYAAAPAAWATEAGISAREVAGAAVLSWGATSRRYF